MRGRLPRISPTGIVVAAAAPVLGSLGVLLGYVALTITAAGAAAGVVAGWLFTVPSPRLQFERRIEPLRVERGRAAMGLVVVRNSRQRRSRSCTVVEQLAGSELEIAVAPLRGKRTASVPYRLPTNRRGAWRIGPLVVRRSDPLGLWQAQRPVAGTTTLLVHPRIHPIDPRPAGRAHHLEGPISETAPRGTLTFHTLREYVAGDDIRRIHWRTTARLGTLMVREHVDTSQPSTVVVLDTRRHRYAGDTFEDAVDVAASVVAASQRKGFPVRLATTSGVTHVVAAGHRGGQLADFLAGVQPDDGDGALEQASIAALGGRDHDVVVVVAGLVDSADLAEVTRFTRRFSYRALVTVRGADAERPRWSGGVHLDGPDAKQAMARWQAHQRAT